jgi:hypothetical protein
MDKQTCVEELADILKAENTVSQYGVKLLNIQGATSLQVRHVKNVSTARLPLLSL